MKAATRTTPRLRNDFPTLFDREDSPTELRIRARDMRRVARDLFRLGEPTKAERALARAKLIEGRLRLTDRAESL